MSARLVWFAAGAGSAVWVGLKGRRTMQRMTPEGVADQFAAARLGLRSLAAEFVVGAAEHEQVLVERLGLGDPPDHSAIGAPRAGAPRVGAARAGATRASEAAGARPRLVAASPPHAP